MTFWPKKTKKKPPKSPQKPKIKTKKPPKHKGNRKMKIWTIHLGAMQENCFRMWEKKDMVQAKQREGSK